MALDAGGGHTPRRNYHLMVRAHPGSELQRERRARIRAVRPRLLVWQSAISRATVRVSAARPGAFHPHALPGRRGAIRGIRVVDGWRRHPGLSDAGLGLEPPRRSLLWRLPPGRGSLGRALALRPRPRRLHCGCLARRGTQALYAGLCAASGWRPAEALSPLPLSRPRYRPLALPSIA